MADYISRKAALELLKLIEYKESSINFAGVMIRELRDMPAADVRPVVRGEWKKAYADHEAFGVRPFYRYCSKCHEATVHQYNFCPTCGADMRKSQALHEASQYADADVMMPAT